MNRFTDGEIIIKEGEISREFYILINGKVGVYKNERKLTQIEKEGTPIGELSGILGLPRTATVKAVGACTMIKVNSEIDRLIKENPDITKNLILNLAERLMKTTDQLSELTEVFDYATREKLI